VALRYRQTTVATATTLRLITVDRVANGPASLPLFQKADSEIIEVIVEPRKKTTHLPNVSTLRYQARYAGPAGAEPADAQARPVSCAGRLPRIVVLGAMELRSGCRLTPQRKPTWISSGWFPFCADRRFPTPNPG
jgi:hypothetical protein